MVAADRGSVVSADGTRIEFRRLGSGPVVILVHGGMGASQNLAKLAAALADEFELIVPDRRGRGRSGPHGQNYGIAREAEDLLALVADTGPTRIFGLSSGAIAPSSPRDAIPLLRRSPCTNLPCPSAAPYRSSGFLASTPRSPPARPAARLSPR